MSTVLLVEEPTAARDQLLRLLEAADQHVTLARDGEDALERWRADRHDIIVVDAAAARLPGLELAARIKEHSAGAFVPTILLTGGDAAERMRALATVEDVVARPYDPGEVEARIKALLRTRRVVEELRVRFAESQAHSYSDAATGLRNRVFLNERLIEEWKRAVRFNEPLAFLLLSIDDFAELEWRAGKVLCDRALQTLAQATLRSLRQIDVVTRFEGAELAALLPNTHFAGSLTCAERLRREIAKSPVDEVLLSVSMGIAFYPGKEVTSGTELVQVAQRALGWARAEGKGNICLFQHQGYLFDPLPP